MTAITDDLAGHLSLLNREFQSRFLQSVEALTAIAATKGLERVKAWANADGSDAARLSAALILTGTAAKLLVAYAEAKRRGDAGELRRIDVRLDKLLGPRGR
jgi:hypothetical protein